MIWSFLAYKSDVSMEGKRDQLNEKWEQTDKCQNSEEKKRGGWMQKWYLRFDKSYAKIIMLNCPNAAVTGNSSCNLDNISIFRVKKIQMF